MCRLTNAKWSQAGTTFDGTYMSRRRQRPAEDVIDIHAVLPLSAGVLLAINSYLILSHFADVASIANTGSGNEN